MSQQANSTRVLQDLFALERSMEMLLREQVRVTLDETVAETCLRHAGQSERRRTLLQKKIGELTDHRSTKDWMHTVALKVADIGDEIPLGYGKATELARINACANVLQSAYENLLKQSAHSGDLDSRFIGKLGLSDSAVLTRELRPSLAAAILI